MITTEWTGGRWKQQITPVYPFAWRHTHTHTDAYTKDRMWAFGTSSKRSDAAAAGTEYGRRKGRERDDSGYTKSVRSNVRSLLSSSALWWALFILADSNLYVRLTSLHRLFLWCPYWGSTTPLTHLQCNNTITGHRMEPGSDSCSTLTSFHRYHWLHANGAGCRHGRQKTKPL